MPRRPTPAAPTPEPGTSLILPPDIRADLLRAQADSIQTPQRFVRVKVLPAAAGLFEFSDADGQAPVREFEGVILAHHARNVLWDKPFGMASTRRQQEENEGPACRSDDGVTGIPRVGFAHAGLEANRGISEPSEWTEADGTERIACATCPYNQWESKHLLPEQPPTQGRGKATTNQRAIFVLTEDRATPVELVVSSTSIPGFDEYLTQLLNHGIPVQTVRTAFRQVIKTKGTLRWAVVTYQQSGTLSMDEFDEVMRQYRQWAPRLDPAQRGLTATPAVETLDEAPAALADDDDMPNF